MTKLRLHAVPHAAQVDVDEAVKFVIARVRQRRGIVANTGIVKRGIQATVRGDGLLDHRRHLGFVGDITTQADCVVSRCAYLLDTSAEHVFATVSKDHGCACFRETPSGGQTYPATGSSDEDNAPVQHPIHWHTPSDRASERAVLSTIQLARSSNGPVSRPDDRVP